MNTKRIPIAFLVGGLAAKALLILAYPLVPRPEIVTIVIKWDPAAVALASWVCSVLFDIPGIAPPHAAVFDVALVIGFGVECWFVGLVVRWLASRSRKNVHVTADRGLF